MVFEELLSAVLQRIQYPEAPGQRAGGTRVLHFDQFEISCRPLDEQCLIQADVAPIPVAEEQPEEWLKRLLKISLAQAAKQTAALALDRERNRLILYRRIPLARATPSSFESDLESLLNELEFWSVEARREHATSALPPLYLMNR